MAMRDRTKPSHGRILHNEEWVVAAITSEAILNGYRGFKPYAEKLLAEAAKKILEKKAKPVNAK
jgi:hypothetical protein